MTARIGSCRIWYPIESPTPSADSLMRVKGDRQFDFPNLYLRNTVAAPLFSLFFFYNFNSVKEMTKIKNVTLANKGMTGKWITLMKLYTCLANPIFQLNFLIKK